MREIRRLNWSILVNDADMMNQLCTYPEYRVAAGGSCAIVQRKPQVSAETFFLFLAACAAAFLFTGIVFVAVKPISSMAAFIAPEASSSYNGSISKSRFLARLSAGQKAAVLNHAHYIAQLINTQGNSAENEQRIALAIVVESFKANYDPLFVAAVIRSESAFNRFAESNQGAHGLMQILPSTAKYISDQHDLEWTGSHRLKDVDYNIRLGIAYLQYLEKMFKGNKEHALIAYNWGPANLASALKKGAKIPTPPVHYARKILNSSQQWRKELDSRMAALKYVQTDSMLS